MSFSSTYWYKPFIVNLPVLSVIYSPISSVPLYNLNFAPCKYSISAFDKSVWLSTFSCSSFNIVSVTFFIFVISKLYVGIFSFFSIIFIVGIPLSSITWLLATVPDVTWIV